MNKNLLVVFITVALAAIGAGIAFSTGTIRFKVASFSATTGSGCSEDDGHNHGAKTKGVPKQAADASCSDDHGSDSVGLVHVSPEQMKLINITISPVVAGNFDNIIKLDGEIRLNMDQTANIMPRLPGFVTKVAVKVGEKVKKRQLLANLTSHKLGEIYAHYNSALEQEHLAKADFERSEKLHKTKAVSKQKYQQAKEKYASAKISLRHAEALLESLIISPEHREHQHKGKEPEQLICTDYEIIAPFNGTIIAKNITIGENFPDDNEKVVFTVSNLDKLWLDLRASSVDLRSVKVGMSVEATPSQSEKSYQGKIIYISPVIDEATRRGLVRVELDNSSGELRAGEFATATIHINSGGNQIVLPRKAVQLIAGETVVFVPREDGFFPQIVQTGKTSNGHVQILVGLKAGNKYVSEGAFELKSILITTGMDPHAGHGH